jgi:hypothetical protein
MNAIKISLCILALVCSTLNIGAQEKSVVGRANGIEVVQEETADGYTLTIYNKNPRAKAHVTYTLGHGSHVVDIEPEDSVELGPYDTKPAFELLSVSLHGA